jgi:hypothetical protein
MSTLLRWRTFDSPRGPRSGFRNRLAMQQGGPGRGVRLDLVRSATGIGGDEDDRFVEERVYDRPATAPSGVTRSAPARLPGA